jgi:serine/threonine-protein kinase RsbW
MIAMITLPAEICYLRIASLTALQVAEIFIESINANQIDTDFAHAFELSVSEAFSNSVFYADESAQENMITMTFSSDTNKLTVSICDTNPPFNPDPPPVDITSYPEKGFGLLLIRQLMDSISYTRENGTNRISMTKQADCTE